MVIGRSVSEVSEGVWDETAAESVSGGCLPVGSIWVIVKPFWRAVMAGG